MTCDQARPLIGAFADGELELAQSAELQFHLSGCGACTAELKAIEALQVSIRRVTPSVASEELRRKITRSLPAPNRARPRFAWGVALAAAFLLAVGGVGLWQSRLRPHEGLVADLVEEHLRSLLPGHLMDVISTDRHTVKPYFTGKTSLSATPWDLKAEGYPLLGGRLDVVGEWPVPVFVYGHGKHFVNLFVLSPEQAIGEWSDDRSGYHLRAWNENGLEYVAVSDIEPPDLQTFVTDFRAQHA